MQAVSLVLCLAERAYEEAHRLIAAPIIEYNETLAGPACHRALVITLHDATTTVPGGMWGQTAYGWLFIGGLFVPAALRGQGVGARVMAMAEREAVARGCRGAWVDTFQARAFYERLGYRCFGEQADCPPGFRRAFLQKSLRPDEVP